MRVPLSIALATASFACGGGPAEAPAPEAKVEAPKPKPPDESRRFPKENQTAMELVDDHALGKDILSGGNVATYERGGQSYTLFLVVMPNAQDASLKMFDLKETLTDSKFVASFGGYFGMDGDTPMFIFAKNKHLAGVVGLPQDEADLVARDFAARIPAAAP